MYTIWHELFNINCVSSIIYLLYNIYITYCVCIDVFLTLLLICISFCLSIYCTQWSWRCIYMSKIFLFCECIYSVSFSGVLQQKNKKIINHVWHIVGKSSLLAEKGLQQRTPPKKSSAAFLKQYRKRQFTSFSIRNFHRMSLI